MRVLFYYLLALNLLYAGWEYIQPVHQSVAVVALPDGLKTLELLDGGVIEAAADQRQPDSEVTDESFGGAPEDPELLALSCFTLGPFKDELIVQQIRESMAEDIEDIKVRVLEESEKHRYWVYIPPLPSRKEAKSVARKLKRSKLKDYYVVLSGNTKNSISLGHFKEPEYANRRAKKVRDLGFAASVEVIYKKYNMHWIDYRARKGDLELESMINSHISEGVSRLDRSCE
jgi:hypothetical protein